MFHPEELTSLPDKEPQEASTTQAAHSQGAPSVVRATPSGTTVLSSLVSSNAFAKVRNTTAFVRRARGSAAAISGTNGGGGVALNAFDNDDDSNSEFVKSTAMSVKRKSHAPPTSLMANAFDASTEDQFDAPSGGAAGDAFEKVQPIGESASLPVAQRSVAFSSIVQQSSNDVSSSNMPQHNDKAASKPSSKRSKTLRKIFDDADSGDKGFLDPLEAIQAMRAFGAEVGKEELVKLYQEISVADYSNVFAVSVRDFSGGMKLQIESSSGSMKIDNSSNESAAMIIFNPQTRKKVEVTFDDFEKLMSLWQSAAKFQLFEERPPATERHLASAQTRGLLLPDSAWVWVWQILMTIWLHYLVFVAIGIFANTDEELPSFFARTTIPDALVSIFLLVDVVMKCFTCVTEVRSDPVSGLSDEVVIEDQWTVVRKYFFSVWFWIDLFSVAPWRFVFAVGGDTSAVPCFDGDILTNPAASGCSACNTRTALQSSMLASKILVCARALKYLECFFYFTETSSVSISKWHIWRQYVVAEGLIVVSRFVLAVHVLSVIFGRIERWDAAEGVLRSTLAGASSLERYSQSVYTVLYCLATVGYGDVRPINTGQMYYLMILCVGGSLFNGFVVGAVVGFFQRSDIQMDRQRKLVETVTILKFFEVPETLQKEILSFQNYILVSSLMKSYQSVVEALPADIQHNLELWTRIQAIKTMPVVCDVHRSAKLQICNALVEITFCPEEYVFLVGEYGEEMFFINHGFVDLLDAMSEFMSTKKAGDFFGEVCAMQRTSTLRDFDAKCITYCECFVLSRHDFLEVGAKYPRIQRAAEDYVFAANASSMEVASVKMKEVLHSRLSVSQVRFRTRRMGVIGKPSGDDDADFSDGDFDGLKSAADDVAATEPNEVKPISPMQLPVVIKSEVPHFDDDAHAELVSGSNLFDLNHYGHVPHPLEIPQTMSSTSSRSSRLRSPQHIVVTRLNPQGSDNDEVSFAKAQNHLSLGDEDEVIQRDLAFPSTESKRRKQPTQNNIEVPPPLSGFAPVTPVGEIDSSKPGEPFATTPSSRSLSPGIATPKSSQFKSNGGSISAIQRKMQRQTSGGTFSEDSRSGARQLAGNSNSIIKRVKQSPGSNPLHLPEKKSPNSSAGNMRSLREPRVSLNLGESVRMLNVSYVMKQLGADEDFNTPHQAQSQLPSPTRAVLGSDDDDRKIRAEFLKLGPQTMCDLLVMFSKETFSTESALRELNIGDADARTSPHGVDSASHYRQFARAFSMPSGGGFSADSQTDMH